MNHLKSISLGVLVLFLMACGGNTDSKKETTDTTTKTEKVEESKSETPEPVEIKLIAKGENMAEMAFEPKSLTVEAGQEVTLHFTNNSSDPAMLHNFVLIPEGIGEEVATEGIKAGADNDYIPDDKRIIAHTKIATNGEEIVITFTAPAAGNYHYICTYPGHYPAMVGRMVVN